MRLHIFSSVQCSSQETQFDNLLVTTRCKDFTYCVCNFVWPHYSFAFIFVQLWALFKSWILIDTETQIFNKIHIRTQQSYVKCQGWSSKSDSAGSESASTTREEWIEDAFFFFSVSPFKYCTSILMIFVEDVGITSTLFFAFTWTELFCTTLWLILKEREFLCFCPLLPSHVS